MRYTFFSLMMFFGVLFASPMALAAPPEDMDMMVETVPLSEGTGTDSGTESSTDSGSETSSISETDTGSDSETGLAPVELDTNEEAVEAARDLYAAITDQNWAMIVAIGLTLLVFGMRKFNLLSKIPTKAIPWVTAGLSMVGYVVAALMAPKAAIGPALLEGLAVGATAIGFWEMALKHVLSSSKEPVSKEIQSPSEEAPATGTPSEDPAKE
jgi:hypothetical protein